jgi:hypothetical protein
MAAAPRGRGSPSPSTSSPESRRRSPGLSWPAFHIRCFLQTVHLHLSAPLARSMSTSNVTDLQWKLVDLLLGRPVITANAVAQRLGVTYPAANAVIRVLVDMEILRPQGKPSHVEIASVIFALLLAAQRPRYRHRRFDLSCITARASRNCAGVRPRDTASSPGHWMQERIEMREASPARNHRRRRVASRFVVNGRRWDTDTAALCIATGF